MYKELRKCVKVDGNGFQHFAILILFAGSLSVAVTAMVSNSAYLVRSVVVDGSLCKVPPVSKIYLPLMPNSSF